MGADSSNKVIVARKIIDMKCYAEDGEILIAASPSAKLPFKIRKMGHFFCGIMSGLPALYGWVALSNADHSINNIATIILRSDFKGSFGSNEEEIVSQIKLSLESINKIPIGCPVVTRFVEKSVFDKSLILKVHRVFLR